MKDNTDKVLGPTAQMFKRLTSMLSASKALTEFGLLKPFRRSGVSNQSLDYSGIASGSAQPKITQKHLANTKVLLPSLCEQRLITARRSTLATKLRIERVSAAKFCLYKSGLMQDLLTGKVRVKVDEAEEVGDDGEISNNVAEGFERGTTKELLNFLYIARGSAGEVRSMLCVMERMLGCADLRSEISNFKLICESISRQIRGWANSLQNSDIEGQRHLNDQSRAKYESRKRKDEYDEGQRRWRADFEAKLKSDAVERHAQAVTDESPTTEDGTATQLGNSRRATQ